MRFAGLKRRFENLYNKKYNKLYVTKNQLPSSAWAKVFFFGVMYIKRGLIAQNPFCAIIAYYTKLFCAITAYCTKPFCAITAYCTRPVLSNKPASRGGLIAQNSLPENIAIWRKWVLEMH